ncbi:MAG: T9SS type A sorting domain-containing protein [Bacteroidota bacterium]
MTGPIRGTYNATGVNSRPSITFNGTSTYYNSSFSFDVQNVFVVFRPNSGTQDDDDLANLWGSRLDGVEVSIDPRPTIPGNTDWSFDGDNSQGNRGQASINGGIPAPGTPAGNPTTPNWSFDNWQFATVSFFNNTNVARSVSTTEQLIGQLTGPSGGFDDHHYGGDIAEVIVYSQSLNNAERTIVENYLSSKYAIPLSTAVGATDDFYEFDANNGGTPNFDWDVAGVGQIDGSSSDWHLESNSSILQVEVSTTNLADGEFLLFGHDNAVLTNYVNTGMPGGFQRVERIWRFDETGDVGDAIVDVNTGNFPEACSGNIYAFVDSDGDGDFTNALRIQMTALTGNTFRFTTNIPDGAAVTFGTEAQLDLTAAAGTNPGEVDLNWTATSLSSTFQEYRVYASTTNPPVTQVATITNSGSLTFTVTGLTACVPYFFRVVGVNNSNAEIECSPVERVVPLDPSIVPPALTLNSANTVAGQGRIEINYSQSGEATFQNYNIYAYASGDPATLSSSVADINSLDETVTFSTPDTYCFVVTQVNACGNESPFSNEICATTTVPGEDCTDEIDNDGDGLTDCFDVGDCSGALGCPQPRPDCEFDPNNNNNATVELNQITIVNVEGTDVGYSTPLVGDVDSDGQVEIVVISEQGNISVVDPVAAIVEYTIDGDDLDRAGTSSPSQALSMADVDRDGYVDFFYKNINNQMVAYSITTTAPGIVLKWRNTTAGEEVINGARPGSSIADINQDGVPEVIVAGNIYDTVTGRLRGRIPTGYDNGAPRSTSPPIFHSTNVFDVLPSSQCAACDGQELLAGNVVYTVDDSATPTWIVTPEVIAYTGTDPSDGPCDPTVSSGASNCAVRDGVITIADVDNDGDLDGVTSGYGRFFVWELQTGEWLSDVEQLTRPSNGDASPYSSAVAIDDFDGDGNLEFGMSYRFGIGIYDYDVGASVTSRVSTIWERETTDESGTTVVSSFDFLGTDTASLVYRDETTIYAYKGVDGTEFYNSQAAGDGACASGTGMEGVVIADVDGDNETEIVAACGQGGTQNIRVFKSGNFPWVPSRSVWNQTLYNIVNVNDNLTIPAVPQDPTALEFLDKFMVQRPLVADDNQVVIPASDLENTLGRVSTLATGSGGCEVNFDVTISNSGDRGITTSYPLSIYENDPTTSSSATLLQTNEVTTALPVGGATTFSQSVDLGVLAPDDTVILYLSLNDTGSVITPVAYPLSPVPECDYGNNLVGPIQVVNCVVILPVDLIEFQAYPQSDFVRLVWKTASEKNNAYFTLERSANGRDFFPIGEVEGRGTTNELQIYRWDDTAPLFGLSYYRLVQTDFDGTKSYSKVRTVRFEGEEIKSEWLIFPNPTSDGKQTRLRYRGNDTKVQVQVFDALGRAHNGVQEFTPIAGQLENDIAIPQSPGIYIIRFWGDQSGYSTKKVVVRP